MFLTTDPDGSELCLRPDLTIPVSRDYLASPDAGEALGFCYLGPVFRHRGEAPAEFVQAGIESFGRRDTAAADAEMLALGLEATAHYGIAAPEIRMGDVGLFAALIAALDLGAGLEAPPDQGLQPRRQPRARPRPAGRAPAAIERPEYQGVLAAIAGSDPKAAHALVTDLLSIAGINAVGGRSVGEIADRFLEQAALGASSGLPRATRALIEQFLAISRRSGRGRRRAAHARGGSTSSIFPPRSTCSRAAPASSPRRASRSRASSSRPRSAAGSTTTPASCSSCTTRTSASTRQLVAGGRYDGLLTRLGAHEPIPAVGFAVWIERLSEIGGAP